MVEDTPEKFDWAASTVQVREAGSLGDLPLVVISANTALMKWGAFNVTAADDQRLGETWLALQENIASLSTNGQLVISKKGFHFIQVEETQLVVDEIAKLVTALQP